MADNLARLTRDWLTKAMGRSGNDLFFAAVLSLSLGFAFAQPAPCQEWTLTSAPVANWHAITVSADGTT
jgi:hypothetical protein